jgi:hypothetical protein
MVSSKNFDVRNVLIAKKFDICKSLLKNFDIFITILFMAAGIFFRHQAELVLRHQMQVSNYFVKFFYSVWQWELVSFVNTATQQQIHKHVPPNPYRDSTTRWLFLKGLFHGLDLVF